MRHTQLGLSGLQVSRIGFGAMTFGQGSGPLSRLDYDGAKRLVDEAVDAGVNLFNTAATYGGGQSEEFLGRALGTRRSDVVIATKVAGATGPSVLDRGLSRRHILAALDKSLARLGTDYVDIYLAHHVDLLTPLEETLETLDGVVRQGKARYIGFSNWPAWVAAKAIGLQRERGWHPFIASESYYSLLGRDIEHELVPFCEDAGVGLLAWSPLAMGFLTGRYTRDNLSGDGGRFNSYDVVPPFDLEHAHRVVDEVRAIAKDQEATAAQVSLAWLLSKRHLSSVLVGASSIEQLRDNLAAEQLSLTDEQIARLDTLTGPEPLYPAWLVQALARRTR